MKNKHRVGNIVRIKKNLLAYVDEKSRCNGCPVSTLMLQHEGKTATITNAYPDKKYRLDVDNGLCYWTDELLVPVSWEYEMRYDVGERVRIRKDLKERDVFGISIISPSMAEQRGKVATIQSVNQSFYFLDINGEGWTEEMFEPVEEEEKTVEKFTRKDLQTCMFGETNDGSIFVVAGNLLVFENGGYDFLYDLLEDLSFKYSDEEATIDRVVKECKSFDMYKKGYGVEVFNRLKPMTLKEIEKALGYRIRLVEEKE